ncbi:methyl-accepting chemotaxis protein [Pyxidicoccus xibeiensis]|uniref:methyl-accepting chemotaxis protein n=1 Tax=Pyxidicoccus xibeiensis TaxID=2906759 RepID=UPI0020A76C08|nr:methyl-accepting chemotaxis protein [Pyxidicoccus xibeiensis]MCP3141146.1 methyl-accepting chemotaxis protein [Pyxidicoccus xibeiensis]
MKFQHKVLLLPGLATVFLLVIVTMSELLGRSTELHVADIERGYVPAVLLGRDLEQLLAEVQRDLQDAVAAEDEDLLAQVDVKAQRLGELMAQARSSPTLDPERLQRAGQDLEAYLRHARDTSARMIRREAQAPSQLAEMGERYNRLRESLRQATQDDQRRMSGAFSELREEHTRAQRWLMGVGLLMLAVLGVLSLWLVAQVARPLTKLNQVASRIATEGDLTQRIDIDSEDELGQLARSFGEVVTRLRTVPLTLREALTELSQSVQGISQLGREQSAVLEHQMASLEEARVAMAEISETARATGAQAGRVLEVAANAETLSTSGQASVEQSVRFLGELREQVAAMVTGIGELSEGSLKASSILVSVKDLTDQSNVLAINAAIEAAKAGEGGRGFAVVAREMRSLSQQSSRSTESIGRILAEMKETVGRVTRSAEADQRRMEAGIAEALASGQSLRDITEVVRESSMAARSIVAAVTMQNAGVNQMSTVVSQLTEKMKEILRATQGTQAAVQRLSAAFARIDGLVSGFRV